MANDLPPVGEPPIAGPKKSHFLRNCLACGCILGLLGVVAFFVLAASIEGLMKKSVVEAKAVPALAAQVAPGTVPPPGTEYKKSVDFSLVWLAAKVVCVAPTGQGKPGTILLYGGFSQKSKTREQLQEQVQKILGAIEASSASQDPDAQTKVVSTVEEELPVGTGTDTVKAVHMVTEDQKTKDREVEYFVVLDPYDNEFGYLLVAAVGKQTTFDVEILKAFLKTVTLKK
jgi:hypothetical protein